MKGVRKRGTAFIEILAQCPVHKKMSPVSMLKMYRENTKRVSKTGESADGKITIGEFCDVEKPGWNEAYQKIIDKFATGKD
jgi:hypothetical protein